MKNENDKENDNTNDSTNDNKHGNTHGNQNGYTNDNKNDENMMIHMILENRILSHREMHYLIGDAPNIADISKMEAHTFHEPVSIDAKSHGVATFDKAVQAHFAPRATRRGRVNGRAVQTRNTIIFSDYSSDDSVRDDEARWEGIPDSL